MAAALEAVHADHVGAQLLRLQSVFNGGALVDHDHAVLFEFFDPLAGVVASRLDDRDLLLDSDIGHLVEIWSIRF